MKLHIVSILASAVLMSAPAWATTGNDLIKWLPDYEKAPGTWGGGMYLGYIAGVSEVGQGILFCAPANVTHGQSAAIVAKYLRNNPEKWNAQASGLIITALELAYPACPPKK